MNRSRLPAVEVNGTGTVSTPGLPVPLPSVEDMARDPATDLAMVLAIRPDSPNAYEELRAAATGWICRCAQSEHFARALETALEKTRNGN